MVAAYKPGRSITLVRNPMFHEWSADARPDGYPDKIVGTLSTVRKNAFPEVRAILQGRADVAPRLVEPPLSRSQLTELATRYPSQVHFTTGWRTESFFLNTRVAPFDRLAVRQAVNEAFDRKAFVRLSGRGVASTCQILPPNYPGYRRACPYGPGGTAAIARARRIIRSSGQAGAAVTVWVPSPRTAQGRFYASFLDDLGFHAHLKVINTASLPSWPYFGRILDRATRAQTGCLSLGFRLPVRRRLPDRRVQLRSVRARGSANKPGRKRTLRPGNRPPPRTREHCAVREHRRSFSALAKGRTRDPRRRPASPHR